MRKAGLRQERTHRLRLLKTMLQQQPASGVQVLRGAGDDAADRVQAIGAAGQGLRGFMAQRVQMRVTFGHVRRVGDDGVEAALRAL